MTDEHRAFVDRAVGQMLRFSHDLERVAAAALDLADRLGIADAEAVVTRAMRRERARLRDQADAG